MTISMSYIATYIFSNCIAITNQQHCFDTLPLAMHSYVQMFIAIKCSIHAYQFYQVQLFNAGTDTAAMQ